MFAQGEVTLAQSAEGEERSEGGEKTNPGSACAKTGKAAEKPRSKVEHDASGQKKKKTCGKAGRAPTDQKNVRLTDL